MSAETAKQVLALIADEGKSLRQIAQIEGMPKPSTFLGWVNASPELAEQYARALEVRAELYADEIVEIADDDSDDMGFKEADTKEGKSAVPFIKLENIQRDRLRVDARKWTASKLFPKKYGDFQRQEHTGAGGGPIAVSLAQQIRGAHGE